jgi:hypothetical protein
MVGFESARRIRPTPIVVLDGQVGNKTDYRQAFYEPLSESSLSR